MKKKRHPLVTTGEAIILAPFYFIWMAWDKVTGLFHKGGGMITKKLVLPTPIKRSKKKPQKKGLLVLVVAGISAIANWKRFKEQWMEWFGTKEETKSKRRK